MNKTVIFLAYAALAALGLLGSVVVLILSPNQFGSFTGYLIVLLGLVTTTAVTFWGLNKAKDQIEETTSKLDVVQRQTNGTLTKLIDRNRELADENRVKDALIASLRAQAMHTPVKVRKDNE